MSNRTFSSYGELPSSSSSSSFRSRIEEMAATMMSSVSLKPSPFSIQKPAAKGLPSLARTSFKIQASGIKKIKTDKPYGIGGGMQLRDGKDANGRKPTSDATILEPKSSITSTQTVMNNLTQGKGVYQFVDKYGANVDGYSPIYNEEEWAPSGDVYVGGTTGLLIWAVTLAGILGGGALLVYSTSALAQ
ncbi:hypothetical protein OSB04_007945 [Centaurea solstitialis]|uniref:Photosystem II 10 kDa polypeptide, chloroplastic n=1 Tax=Centaurea solstitialis TaxID=347529 RepID=A0AA38TKU0_9ASTR|nr:hypothetical protein OSB04_007945 [Centaurea solstitialis]